MHSSTRQDPAPRGNAPPPAGSLRQGQPSGLFDPAADIVLASGNRGLIATGTHRSLSIPAAAITSDAVRGFLDAPESRAGAPILAGALPFDRARPALLRQPLAVRRGALSLVPAPDGLAATATVTAEPPAAAYADSVRAALGLMAPPARLRKVVLSRSLLVRSERPIDVHATLARLASDPHATLFCLPLPGEGEPRILLGATPELLVSRRGRTVLSHPLAGSARRLPDAAADRAAADRLLRSDKNHREHAAVVEAVLDTLSPYCAELDVPQGPALISTLSMWHLGTRIEGVLRDPQTSVAELAARLHPTPAVCGLPRRMAADVIGQLETVDRGFYAGAVGWCDADGDGDWHVAIRCAEIAGGTARLYAGAGIVPGSDPDDETAETGAKFAALMNALGLAGRLPA